MNPPLSLPRGLIHGMERELYDYLRIGRKRAWLVVTATLACTIVALLASLSAAPVYQGTAKLLVVAKSDPAGGTSSAYSGALLSQQLVKSFAQILESRATAEAALRLDPQSLTPRELQGRIKAEPITDTLLINLGVEDTDPSRAKRLANSVARAFIQSVPELQSGSTLRVSLVEPALTPNSPVKPRTKLNIAVGFILGLMLGIGLALLREFLDRSVKTPEALETAADAPVVGTIPPFKAAKQPIPVSDQPRTPAAEAFRKLRTNFAFLGIDREHLCCVVTSPSAGDGKSTVAANLGTALAQAGQRVVLVDADLRKPSLHRLFGLEQRVGTTAVLLDHAYVRDALQHQGPNLPAVLTSGQLPPNPSELLGSRRMAELLEQLRSEYEVILVDCPPLLPVTDPMAVARFADGILLVARAGKTTKDQAGAARAACMRAGATLFGTVLNASAVIEGDQSAYYAYYGEKERRGRATDPDVRSRLSNGNGSTPVKVDGTRVLRHGRMRSGSK
jgi:capsular exopolysaccharide synthesis family protein